MLKNTAPFEAAYFPKLQIAEKASIETEIVFGAPTMIRDALSSLPNLRLGTGILGGR